MLKYPQWREILKNERLPAVVVDLDAFDRNIDKLQSILKGHSKRLRLATKSVRVPELIARVLKRGGVFQGLMCFSAEEIEFLSNQKIGDDYLLAYPTLQKSDLDILRRLHERGVKVSLVVDSAEGLRALSQAMGKLTAPFRVILDVDMSYRLFGGLVHLGVRRSPLRSAAAVKSFLKAARHYPNLKVIGAMGYEAQVAGLGDRNPFKRMMNPIFGLIRKISMRQVVRLRAQIAQAFKDEGVALEVFNGGGTGTVNLAAEEAALTELSAGSALLSSHLFDYYSNVHFEPACFFALQTVRSSDAGYITCQGGGYIASGEPGWDRLPVPALPEGLKLVSMEGCGEVQTPLLTSGLGAEAKLSLSDPVLFRHAKAGELAERFNEYLLVSGDAIVGRAKTYRGFGQSYF